MIAALIVAAFAIIVLGICWFADHERLIAERKESAKAWGSVSEKADQIGILNEYAAHQRERADRLLSQIYDLRQQMGLAPRAHTECVDMWADGRAPCEKCAPLLPGART